MSHCWTNLWGASFDKDAFAPQWNSLSKTFKLCKQNTVSAHWNLHTVRLSFAALAENSTAFWVTEKPRGCLFATVMLRIILNLAGDFGVDLLARHIFYSSFALNFLVPYVSIFPSSNFLPLYLFQWTLVCIWVCFLNYIFENKVKLGK